MMQYPSSHPGQPSPAAAAAASVTSPPPSSSRTAVPDQFADASDPAASGSTAVGKSTAAPAPGAVASAPPPAPGAAATAAASAVEAVNVSSLLKHRAPWTEEADLQLGLTIDFNAIYDVRVVAPWARFFRDQYNFLHKSALEALERQQKELLQAKAEVAEAAKRKNKPPAETAPTAPEPPSHAHGLDIGPFLDKIVPLFVEELGKEIIPSPEMQQVLRSMPFSSRRDLDGDVPSPVEEGWDSEFAEAAFVVMFAQTKQLPVYDTKPWRQFLWKEKNIGSTLCAARTACRTSYIAQIQRVIDEVVQADSSSDNGEALSRKMLAATERLNDSSCSETIVVFANLDKWKKELAKSKNAVIKEEEGSPVKKEEEADEAPTNDSNDDVRKLLAPLEQAFVLTAARKHLLATLPETAAEATPQGGESKGASSSSFCAKDVHFMYDLCDGDKKKSSSKEAEPAKEADASVDTEQKQRSTEGKEDESVKRTRSAQEEEKTEEDDERQSKKPKPTEKEDPRTPEEDPGGLLV